MTEEEWEYYLKRTHLGMSPDEIEGSYSLTATSSNYERTCSNTEFELTMRRKTADMKEEQIMVKYVEMRGFDVFTDNLEEFVNKQGCTFGEHAGQLQKLLDSIIYCFMHGVVTGSQQKQMLEKYGELLEEAITVKE